jgi:hypothetical protein
VSYARHAATVVAGLAFALSTYPLLTGAALLVEALVYGLLFLLGLFVAVHGLFTGVEAAVAAGESSADPEVGATE